MDEGVPTKAYKSEIGQGAYTFLVMAFSFMGKIGSRLYIGAGWALWMDDPGMEKHLQTDLHLIQSGQLSSCCDYGKASVKIIAHQGLQVPDGGGTYTFLLMGCEGQIYMLNCLLEQVEPMSQMMEQGVCMWPSSRNMPHPNAPVQEQQQQRVQHVPGYGV